MSSENLKVAVRVRPFNQVSIILCGGPYLGFFPLSE